MADEHRSSRASEDRPIWSFSRDDKRFLLITFLGGVMSIMAGAAVIGAAIAYARWERVNQGGTFSLLVLINVLMGVFFVGATIAALRERHTATAVVAGLL